MALLAQHVLLPPLDAGATPGPPAGAAAASRDLADVAVESLRGQQLAESDSQATGSGTQQQPAGEQGARSGAAGRPQAPPAAMAPVAAPSAPAPAGSGSSSSQGPDQRCARCGATPGGAVKLRLCACRLVRYCGERCQREDWPGHKAACKEARRRSRRKEGAAG